RCDARFDPVERLLEKVTGEFLRELARSFMPVPVLGEIDAEGLREEVGEPRASAAAAAGFFGERRAGRAREGIVKTGTERQPSQLAGADAGRGSDAFERGGAEMDCDEFEPAVDSPDGWKVGRYPEHLSRWKRVR